MQIHSFFNVCTGCYVILVAHGCKAHSGLLPSFVYITFGRVLQGCCFPPPSLTWWRLVLSKKQSDPVYYLMERVIIVIM